VLCMVWGKACPSVLVLGGMSMKRVRVTSSITTHTPSPSIFVQPQGHQHGWCGILRWNSLRQGQPWLQARALKWASWPSHPVCCSL
jgi:hypothetical protein